MRASGWVTAVAALLVCTIAFSCGDEAKTPKAGCAQRDLDVCQEARTVCSEAAQTADNPVTANEACKADWCTCIEDAGCILEDYRECTDR